MIKLPEPITTVKSLFGEYASCKFTDFSIRKGDKLYTEAQLKQAVRDLAQPPAPDCRTCVNASVCHFHFNAPDCTNGDQYQPAPKVVLWRTAE